MGSYGKNQKKIKEYFGEMGQKDQFWPKTAKFWPKKSNLRIFTKKKFRHFLKDQKTSSYGKNQKKQDKAMIGSPEKKDDKTTTRRPSFQCNLLYNMI